MRPRGPAATDTRMIDLPATLFIDGEALVVDKPAGLATTTPKRGGPSLEALLPELRFGFGRPPAIVHRLDQDTSGCLILARNPKALKRFGQAFEAGGVAKLYLGVVEGVPEAEEGLIDMSLGKVSSAAEGWRMTRDPNGKTARTRWRRLGAVGGRALVAFMPETGRTHQIRVHAAEGLGAPLVGDAVYGRPDGVKARLALHAHRISLPRDGKPPVAAEAPVPPLFATLGFPDIAVPPCA